ncbi:MAG: hypothetical protein F6K47_20960 [Symploca sp. SIO2E6]|nr:hypothetical protein [Symploca sp. SIO2E6]
MGIGNRELGIVVIIFTYLLWYWHLASIQASAAEIGAVVELVSCQYMQTALVGIIINETKIWLR